MNRPLLITSGIIILLLVVGVWVYLMFFGTPKSTDEVFTNFGFNLGSQEVTVIPSAEDGSGSTFVDTQTDAMRQLTTRPIAGFAFASTTGGEVVRYVERGTGHIYQIDLTTGKERVLSRTTIPQVNEATFSKDSEVVALVSHSGYQSEIFVGKIGADTNLIGISLQPNATNIAFSSNNEVLYSVSSNGTTKGYLHNIETLVQSELFSMNYTNLDVGWGNELEKIYLATKPAQGFEGFIYTIKNNILIPATFSANGLSALFSKDYILTTFIQNNTYTSAAVANTGIILDLPLIALKEKCVFDAFNIHYVWCASPLQDISSTFVADWYKGTVTSEDFFWLVDLETQTAEMYGNPQNLTGRTIDVKSISMNANGTALSFINKLDHTLWLYDLMAN